MKKLTALVLTALLSTFIAVPAKASTGCDIKEAALVNAISSATVMSTITTAASSYRSCLATYADSRNSYSSYFSAAGGSFYTLFTATNMYNMMSSRKYMLKAAADYRMDLLGEESTVNGYTGSSTCSYYTTVIGTASGFGDISLMASARDASTLCASIRSVPGGKVTTSNPADPQAGTVITGYAGRWPNSVSLGYRWARENVYISGATATTYTTTAADVGSRLRFCVTASGAGLNSVTRCSPFTNAVTAPPIALAPIPTVTGTFEVAKTLTANPGTWESGATISYQWQRNGVNISNANAKTYLLAPEDAGQTIRVVVVGTKTGFSPTAKASIDHTIDYGHLVLRPDLKVTGDICVGSNLVLTLGTYDPGVTLSYQWKADGNDIQNADQKTLTLTNAELSKSLSIVVTATKPGYYILTQTLPLGIVQPQAIPLTGTPTIWGVAQVDLAITVDPGTWTTGTTFEYTWMRNDLPIANTDSANYTPTTDDFGKKLSVRITGSKTGYGSVSKTVNAGTVTAALLTPTALPTIIGTLKVGKTLSVLPGTWMTGTKFAYVWMRNGKAITGATKSTYVLTAADKGTKITVKLTGSKYAYTSPSRTSAPTGKIG